MMRRVSTLQEKYGHDHCFWWLKPQKKHFIEIGKHFFVYLCSAIGSRTQVMKKGIGWNSRAVPLL
jgi:hypothetical protein